MKKNNMRIIEEKESIVKEMIKNNLSISKTSKKYNVRTLRSMRQLYVMFSDDFWKPVVSKLSWTNLLLIMPLKEKIKCIIMQISA